MYACQRVHMFVWVGVFDDAACGDRDNGMSRGGGSFAPGLERIHPTPPFS
jgi:hypothetical protein